MSRIVGGKEDISYNSVELFFKQRSNSNLKHKYNYVMYLDDYPEIAIQRDIQAKAKVESLLTIQEGMSVLDLGCGVGRWGELFCKKGTNYVGIDVSEKMIIRAKENLRAYDNKKFLVGNLCEIRNFFQSNSFKVQTKFDIIFICGVLMYLNDNDVITILQMLPDLMKTGGNICLIESMAERERLTLKDIFSEELKQYYSAIYRTVDEFKTIMSNAFGNRLNLKLDELLDFSDGLQKKREHITMEHCVIWESTQ